jgi:hypothetical protein
MDLKTTLENKKWAKESLLGSLAEHNLPKTIAKREQLNTEIDEIDKALLILFGVGQQRELLNQQCELLSQYNDFVNMQYHGVSLDDSDIKDFNDWLNCA